MASIPGHCDNCGFVFDGSGGIHIKNSTNVRVSDSRMTCPNCGRMAKLVEGVFSEHGRGLELISGPPLTYAILRQLHDIAQRAQREELSPSEVIAQVQKVDANLASFLRKIPKLDLLATFLMIVSLYIAFEGNRSSSEFQKEALTLLREKTSLEQESVNILRHQSELLQIIAARGARPNDNTVEQTRDRNSATKAAPKSKATESRSNRRQKVVEARRKELKERRKAFPRRNRFS